MIAFSALCASGCQQSDPRRESTDVIVPRLVQDAVAYGEMRDLNAEFAGQPNELSLRLFGVPDPDAPQCFVETHGVCSRRYVLATATLDEYPETGLFLLESRGDVVDLQWEGDDAEATRFVMVMDAYTRAALANNPALERGRKRYRVAVSPQGVETLELP